MSRTWFRTSVCWLGYAFALVGCTLPTDAADSIEPLGQQVVQGRDNRTLISRQQSTAYPWRTFAAFRPLSGRRTASCSAFKVGPRHLLTAAHCFEGRDEDGNFISRATKNTVRLVFGQFGSGHEEENMPVDGHSLRIEDVYIPPSWTSSNGTDQTADWALMRMYDADSSRGWLNTRPRSTTDLQALSTLYADGFPLDQVTQNSEGTDSPCAESPLPNKDCGGYQYQAPASINGLSQSFLNLSTDWDRGQSGGPIYAVIPSQSQRVAVGILTFNDGQLNYARRITNEISDKICEQIRQHPSTRYPRHECGQ